MPTDRPTHQTVTERQPGDGVEVSAGAASQSSRRSPSSRRSLWVLIVSFVLAIGALGVYWAGIAPGLQRADKSGQPEAHGQLVTNTATAGQFHAPEPAPKQPPTDQIARSSGRGGG